MQTVLCLNFLADAHYYYLDWVYSTCPIGYDVFKRCYGNGNFEHAAVYI